MCLNVKYYEQKANEQNEEIRFFFSPFIQNAYHSPRIEVYIESWASCIVSPPTEAIGALILMY